MQNPSEALNEVVKSYVQAHPQSEQFQKVSEDPMLLLELTDEQKQAILEESDPARIIRNALAEADLPAEEKVELALEAVRQTGDTATELMASLVKAAERAHEFEHQRMSATIAALVDRYGPLTIEADAVQRAVQAIDRVTSTIDEAAGTLTYALRPVVPGSDKVQ